MNQELARGKNAAPTNDKKNEAAEKAFLPRRPHSADLRKGRVSIPEECYFVTTCATARRPVFLDPNAATIVIEGLRWLRDQGRIHLLGFVVMPDHLHMAFALQTRQECRSHNPGVRDETTCGSDIPVATLSDVMKVLKGFTSRVIRERLGLQQTVWQDGYHDHRLRDRSEFETRLAYMHDNPVRQGLVKLPAEYQFSTAHPDYEKEIDWAWLEGGSEETDRGRNAAPTNGKI